MSVDTSHHNDASSKKISQTFNQAAGDFALISSDEIIFYIPRTVLQLSSKGFETMFEAGTPSTEDQTPIHVQAEGKHLEIILKFAHSALVSPKVDNVMTLAQLLRIAKQYEMDGVLGQLRGWFIKTSLTNAGIMDSISTRDPLAAFVMAISFDCVEEARYALREVIKCDLSQKLGEAKTYEIPLYLMQRIKELRAERTAWYILKVVWLSRSVIRPCPVNSSDTRDSALSRARNCPRWQGFAMKTLHARRGFPR